MLEASLIAGQFTDLRIYEWDQFLLYMRNLPDKVAEYVQLHCGATTVPRVWEAVQAYYTRMRLTHELDGKVQTTGGGGKGGSEVTCHNFCLHAVRLTCQQIFSNKTNVRSLPSQPKLDESNRNPARITFAIQQENSQTKRQHPQTKKTSGSENVI